jgi:hypothetical protein
MIAAPPAPEIVYGMDRPRIAPPLPLRSKVDEYVTLSHALGIDLMPWQCNALRYLTAIDADYRPLYREVAIVVARQNGKTTLLVPFVVMALRMGLRVMHTAQNRVLPRDVFEQVAEILTRAGVLKVKPRFANGQEVIKTRNGGIYRIVAPTRGGARGPSNDVVIIDELREMDDFGFIGAAKPTLTASKSPLTIYLSNAGTDESAVLNALRLRADEDSNLAYLEWSAEPDRHADDLEGWRESNPAIGHIPAVIDTLFAEYQANRLAGTMAVFETEHLCRWVPTMRPRLVDEFGWMRCKGIGTPKPRRPSFGISLDPDGTRASVVMAWREDKTICIKELFDVKVSEEGLDDLGEDAMKTARRLGAAQVGHDDRTDRAFARHFKTRAKAIIGKDFDQASVAFVQAVERNEIRWFDGEHITEDLKSTSRKDNDETGTYHAVKSKDDVPITAALAAIRAFWLASASSPTGSLQVR